MKDEFLGQGHKLRAVQNVRDQEDCSRERGAGLAGVAIDTIDFDGALTRDGKEIHFRGNAILACKKQKNGTWKIFRYMYDEIPAKKGPAPPH